MSRNSDLILAANQIASQLGSVSQAFAPAGSNLGKLGEAVEGTSRAVIMQENLKRQREEERKARRKSKWGNIGAMAGGMLAAPFTGGASLAATAGMMGAGSAVGGMVGSAAGGGGFNTSRMVGDFTTGAGMGMASHVGGQMLSGMGGGGSTAVPRGTGDIHANIGGISVAPGAPSAAAQQVGAAQKAGMAQTVMPAPQAQRPGFFGRMGQAFTNMGVATNPMMMYGAGIMAPRILPSGSDPNRQTIYFPGM